VWAGGEVVFTVAFAGCALLRSFSPDVWQTEKPMDMALVNAAGRADWFPPADPWYSGADVNYYYWGHYLVSFLNRATGVEPPVGFNAGLALVFGLTAAAVYGLVATLFEALRAADGRRGRSPVAVGVAGTALAMVAGNVAGGLQIVRETSRVGTYDWWAPSRVIDGTANEFPAFSFLLGDLHAHVLVTPLTLTAFAYAVQLALRGPPRLSWRSGRARAAAELALAAVILGALFATNSFDYPTACVVGVGALLLWTLEAPGRAARAAAWGAAWLASSVLLFLPFWLSFSPTTKGLATIGEEAPFREFARDYALIYGVALWILLTLFVDRFRIPARYAFWGFSVALFVLVLLAGEGLAARAVALALAAVATYAALSSRPVSQPYRVVWLLVAVALALLASGEVVYVRDVFEATPSFRFNTVFKTGYQAWFLLAIVAAVVAFTRAQKLGPRVRRVWVAGLAAVVALAAAYPIFAAHSRSGGFDDPPTLDGLRWLRQRAPDDVAAIEWLQRAANSGSPTLLETVGRAYDPDGRARVSTFTGMPAVIGWPGHEVQWGHDPATRPEDVRRIYETKDVARARRLLQRYRVTHVFVGELERRDYSAASLAKFKRLGDEVFRSGRTVIYRVRGAPTR
jgi:YYY domain-containing protein